MDTSNLQRILESEMDVCMLLHNESNSPSSYTESVYDMLLSIYRNKNKATTKEAEYSFFMVENYFKPKYAFLDR